MLATSAKRQVQLGRAKSCSAGRTAQSGSSSQGQQQPHRFSTTVTKQQQQHRQQQHKHSTPSQQPPPPHVFSEPSWRPARNEIALIRRSWPTDDMIKEQIGTEVYAFVFEREPDCLPLFPSFARYGLRLGLRSDEFFVHLTKFVNVLEYVIDNLHQPPDVIGYLRALGARHSSFVAEHKMRAYYWRVFGDAIAHAVASVITQPMPSATAEQRLHQLTAEQMQQIVELWRELGEWVMLEVREGYRTSLGHRQSEPSAAADDKPSR